MGLHGNTTTIEASNLPKLKVLGELLVMAPIHPVLDATSSAVWADAIHAMHCPVHILSHVV